MSVMQDYLQAVDDCAQQCVKMLEVESEKRRALMNNEGKNIEAAVKTQQAALMKLETLEARRIQLQTALGFDENCTVSEILDRLPEGADRERLRELAQKLKECATELREQNRQSLELAKLDMRLIESLRGKAGLPETGAGLYAPSKMQDRPMGSSKFNSSF